MAGGCGSCWLRHEGRPDGCCCLHRCCLDAEVVGVQCCCSEAAEPSAREVLAGAYRRLAALMQSPDALMTIHDAHGGNAQGFGHHPPPCCATHAATKLQWCNGPACCRRGIDRVTALARSALEARAAQWRTANRIWGNWGWEMPPSAQDKGRRRSCRVLFKRLVIALAVGWSALVTLSVMQVGAPAAATSAASWRGLGV